MVGLCSCLDSSGTKLKIFFENKADQPVTLNESIDACSRNEDRTRCAANVKECVSALSILVNQHNASVPGYKGRTYPVKVVGRLAELLAPNKP